MHYIATLRLGFFLPGSVSIGYQHHSPDAFPTFVNLGRDIDDPYVDGLSITYGMMYVIQLLNSLQTSGEVGGACALL